MNKTKSVSARQIASEYLRVVWTIGTKDIAEALRNKTTLANILVVVGIVIAYKYMLTMTKKDDSFLVVFDVGHSSLMTALVESPGFNPLPASSMADFEEHLDDFDVRELGLVIPADFDRQLVTGESVELKGYTSWANRGLARKSKSDYERRLGELVARSVHIELVDAICPDPDSMGPSRWTGITSVLAIFFMGTLVVPPLMFEEKQTKTLDALLISPASVRQMVLGKALAGLFYCMLAAIVVLSVNWMYIVSWVLVVLSALCALLFSVGMGLLAGSFCENKQQLMVWSLIPAQILLVPVFLMGMEPILPDALRAAISWIPTVAQAELFRYAFSAGAPFIQVLASLSIALVAALLILALVAWRIGRWDR